MNRSANRFRAKKRLGQHFLVDEHVVSRIIDAIAPQPEDTIVEIGPGLGSLTAPLLKRQCRVEAVEIDRALVDRLKQDFARYESFRLHHADALKFDFSALASKNGLRVVGNLPYNVSTPLLIRLFKSSEHVLDMHLMLQTEVVERIVAAPGSRNYSRLSVITDCFVKTQYLFDVPPEAFSPPPKVSSSVVRLLPHPCAIEAHRQKAFFSLVSKAFSQRRKTIGRIFSGIFNSDDFSKIRLCATVRPQELEVKHFLAMLDLLDGKPADDTEVK